MLRHHEKTLQPLKTLPFFLVTEEHSVVSLRETVKSYFKNSTREMIFHIFTGLGVAVTIQQVCKSLQEPWQVQTISFVRV